MKSLDKVLLIIVLAAALTGCAATPEPAAPAEPAAATTEPPAAEEAAAEPTEAWRHRDMRNQMNPSLLIDGHLYGIDGDEGKDGTGLKCLDLATGAARWTDAATGHGALTAADGKLIVLTESGELQIGSASPDGFAPTSKTPLFGPKGWTVPVLSHGRIYCRNSKGDVVVVGVNR